MEPFDAAEAIQECKAYFGKHPEELKVCEAECSEIISQEIEHLNSEVLHDLISEGRHLFDCQYNVVAREYIQEELQPIGLDVINAQIEAAFGSAKSKQYDEVTTVLNSPYSSVAEQLSSNGYSAIPIAPNKKYPGAYDPSMEQWTPMKNWTRFAQLQPSQKDLTYWCTKYPDAGVGIVLGPASSNIIAIDIDNATPEMMEVIERVLIGSDVSKVGAKGYTDFYSSDGTIKPQKFFASVNGKRSTIFEVLAHGNQTVIPPSIHPDTLKPYTWKNAGCDLVSTPPEELPVLTQEKINELVEALKPFDIEVKTDHNSEIESRTGGEYVAGGNIFDDVNISALENPEAWVPDLNLYNCVATGDGFKAVATWRASNTSRDLKDRKQNLFITRRGITDFGSKGYNPCQLVSAAMGLSIGDACDWLCDRVSVGLELPMDVEAIFANLDRDERARLAAIETHKQEVIQQELIHTQQAQLAVLAESTDEHERFEAYLMRELKEIGGVVHSLTQYLHDSSDAKIPCGEFITAVGYCSGLVARHWVLKGEFTTHANVYVGYVAGAGYGKTSLMTKCSNVFKLADDRLGRKMKTPYQPASDSGGEVKPHYIMSAQTLIRGGDVTSGSTLYRQLKDFGVMVAPIDEFGGFIKKMYGKGNATFQDEIRTNILKIYSASNGSFTPVAKAGLDDELPIPKPCLSIVGATTLNDFFAHPVNDMIEQGAIPRFVLYIEDRDLIEFGDILEVNPTHIADEINGIINHRMRVAAFSKGSTDSMYEPECEYLKLTPVQNKLVKEWRNSCLRLLNAANKGSGGGEIYSRVVENALKVALIIQVGVNPQATTVSDRILNFAYHTVKYFAERALNKMCATNVPTNSFDKKTRDNLRFITEQLRTAGSKGMTKQALNKKLSGRHVKSKESNELIATLVDAGIARISELKQESGVGRPTTTYYFVAD